MARTRTTVRVADEHTVGGILAYLSQVFGDEFVSSITLVPIFGKAECGIDITKVTDEAGTTKKEYQCTFCAVKIAISEGMKFSKFFDQLKKIASENAVISPYYRTPGNITKGCLSLYGISTSHLGVQIQREVVNKVKALFPDFELVDIKNLNCLYLKAIKVSQGDRCANLVKALNGTRKRKRELISEIRDWQKSGHGFHMIESCMEAAQNLAEGVLGEDRNPTSEDIMEVREGIAVLTEVVKEVSAIVRKDGPHKLGEMREEGKRLVAEEMRVKQALRAVIPKLENTAMQLPTVSEDEEEETLYDSDEEWGGIPNLEDSEAEENSPNVSETGRQAGATEQEDDVVSLE